MTRRFPGFQFRDQIGQLAVARRAAHQAHPGRALEDLLAFLLRDAAQHADNFFCRRDIFGKSPRRENIFCAAFSRMLQVL